MRMNVFEFHCCDRLAQTTQCAGWITIDLSPLTAAYLWQSEVKAKLSLRLIKHYDVKTYRGVEV
jgi:hypothetical protein